MFWDRNSVLKCFLHESHASECSELYFFWALEFDVKKPILTSLELNEKLSYNLKKNIN